MENASKALIIAGAILLSILIIALGVFIFNQAKSSVGNVGLSDQEVAAFNSKWESYEGKQLGSSVRNLVTQVNNYNRTANDGRYITLVTDAHVATGFNDENPGKDTTSSTSMYSTSYYNAGTSYDVKMHYTSGGLVAYIQITK